MYRAREIMNAKNLIVIYVTLTLDNVNTLFFGKFLATPTPVHEPREP